MVNIKVGVRIRPMTSKESKQKESVIVDIEDKNVMVANPKIAQRSDGGDSRQKVRKFEVDYCFDAKYPQMANQQAIFQEIGSEVLSYMWDGYNSCVLAYGHSASGKTYTMMGTKDDPGLTPRICSQLCRTMNQTTNVDYHVTASFLEIYNEKVRDLLVDDGSAHSPAFSLRVREHPKLGPYVQDLSEHVITGEEHLLSLLNLGNGRRSTAATEANIHSSRSHAVFTIKFKQVANNTTKSSKVHLVDLAGSERAKQIQSRARLKEGAKINKSLVTLGNVISTLAESSQNFSHKCWQPFVPYRDSVLTWLLKDTLGGNSNTIMIATISPASSCHSDTINTLRYAKRTKKIVNQPTVNEDPKVRTIRELREEVEKLKLMLHSYTSQSSESTSMADTSPSMEESSFSKWQQGRATLCAVGLQTEDMDCLPPWWMEEDTAMVKSQNREELSSSEPVERCSSSPYPLSPIYHSEQVRRNIATLDILPNIQSSCVSVYVSENQTGVNRVIADPARFPDPARQRASGSSSSGAVSRVPYSPFKRRRALLRRNNPFYWTMLHRSRPDLIKGIGARNSEGPSTSGQGLADVLSQSASDNSLHSSGSAESRPRLQPAASLSRASSVGEASGSSTPTQSSRPTLRKKENKRAEIVASVTSRLYAIKKKPDPRMEALQAAAEKEDDEEEDLEELKLCKRARMKLFDLSRKLAMTKKVKRTVECDTQTETKNSTLMVREKGVATHEQGILLVQSCATNTPKDPLLKPPIIPFNQLRVLPNGSVLIECGSSQRVSSSSSDTSIQTDPEYVDHATSPKKMLEHAFDEVYSDDSLESDCSNPVNFKSRSFQNLHKSSHPQLLRQHSIPNNLHLSQTHEHKTNKIIEKNLEPISRYEISGTNAVYEYDPNKSKSEIIVYPNDGPSPIYGPGATPKVVYPQYQPELFNGLPVDEAGSREVITSSDDAISNQNKSPLTGSYEDNSSSNTSSASTGSLEASDTSSEDFVFMDSTNQTKPVPDTRELYTISENSEPSCSNRSSPLPSQSPRHELINEQEVLLENASQVEEKNNEGPENKLKDEKQKKVTWSKMECFDKNQFLNFKYKSNVEDRENDEEASEDSITFVFLGSKKQNTSVLMELIKRSLRGGSEETDVNKTFRSRSRGVQCSSELRRSVSVDTAMIALSRLARHHRSDVSRSTSLSNVASVQVDLDEEIEPERYESGTQCCIAEKVNVAVEVRPADAEVQCNLQPNISYSLGTNTSNDKETLTDKETTQSMTQTDNDQFFQDDDIQLPRITGVKDHQRGSTTENSHWKDLRSLILGTSQDLFPNYLQSYEKAEKSTNRPRKSVSWSDVRDVSDGEEAQPAAKSSSPTRRVRFSEPDDKPRSSTLPKRYKPETDTMKTFLKQATNILQNIPLTNSDTTNSETDDSPRSTKENHSQSLLLRRRKRRLTKIKLESKTLIENSVQTETEKIDQHVQTGGFAASLVGPPIRRSLTPNFRVPSTPDETSTSTWPRRRTSAKPPTGLKPPSRASTPRPGSTAGRVSSPSFSFNASPSRISSQSSALNFSSQGQLNTPSTARYRTPSPELQNRLQLEQSIHRLQNAIDHDRVRHGKLRLGLQKFSDLNHTDYDSYQSKFPNYDVSEPQSVSSSSYSDRPKFLKSTREERFNSCSTEDFSYEGLPSSQSYARTTTPVSSYGTSYRSPSPLLCLCKCHEVVSPYSRYCHACCVPCQSEPETTNEWRPHHRESPSAHLRHLIALRRTIVGQNTTT